MRSQGEGNAPLAVMPPGPLIGPAAWYGRDMAGRDDWIFALSADEIAEIERAVAAFARSGAALADVSPATFDLPRLAPRLADVRRELLDGRGFVLIRGLPVDRYT